MSLVPAGSAPARPSASNPFHEGYIAASRAEASRNMPGLYRPVTPCPYPIGSVQYVVWKEGFGEWALDRDAGLTPPNWRL